MDGRVRFSKILTVQIQHIRLWIACAPDGCHRVPSDIQSVRTRPMLRNREVLHDDFGVWNRVKETMLPRNGAPRHGQRHDSIIMLAGGRTVVRSEKSNLRISRPIAEWSETADPGSWGQCNSDFRSQ